MLYIEKGICMCELCNDSTKISEALSTFLCKECHEDIMYWYSQDNIHPFV